MSTLDSHEQEEKMPRPQRAPDEVDAVKQGILETALTVLNEEGYIKMSMNKVAERTGMTAANNDDVIVC